MTFLSRLTWRGVPLATVALLLAGPLLFNLLNQMSFFGLTLRAVDLGQPPRLVAWLGSLYALTYIGSSLATGHRASPGLSRWLLRLVPVALGVLVGVSRLAGSFWQLLLIAAAQGVIAGLYFTPFQIVMGDVRPFRTLAWTVAFYNVSWGSGLALGPVLSALFRTLPGTLFLGVGWAVVLVHSGLALAGAGGGAPGRATVTPAATVGASTRGQRLCGWLGVALASALSASLLGCLWPPLARARQLPDWQIGLGAALIGTAVALGACLWARGRRALARPSFLVLLLLLGALGMLALPLAGGYLGLLVALLGVGVMESGVFFVAVYYVNADPVSPARSVGINEAIVGTGSVTGPLLFGTLAWNDAGALRPYVAAAFLLAAAASAVPWLWRRPEPPGCPVQLQNAGGS